MADPTDRLSANDKAALHTAATGEGAVPLTPPLLDEIMQSLKARYADIAERYPALVEACPYEMKLAIVAWVFKHLHEHMREPGSYRYLIYDRLGFGPDSYVPLCRDGLMLSNIATELEELREKLKCS